MQSSLPADNLVTASADAAADPALDAELRRGVLRTDVARPVAWALVGSFLLAIFALPLSQLYLEQAEEEESPLLDLWRREPTAENLRQVEHDLEQASYAKAFVQPRLQLLLTRFGRVGNRRAVVGRDGWLYYTPGVQHVAGPGFLNPDVQRQRELDERGEGPEGEAPIHADPRPAILDFNARLAQRNIRLVLMPVPDKAAVEAESLHARGRPSRLPENPDLERFLAELRAEGVAVFDARQLLPGAEQHPELQGPERNAGEQRPSFLVQDTHWTPAWMEHVARGLAASISELGVLGAAPASALHAVEQSAERVGDLVDMLKLPDDQALFLPQAVQIHPVADAQGNAWEPDPSAEILLLGDSFTDVFSLEGMGWGAAAGLAPQLALALQRPLDVIAQNDSGAFVTRRALARELAAGNDRLAGKRVVIWEFAARELSAGDWQRIELPEAVARGGELMPIALITGAAGVMGARLVERVRDAGWQVRALVLPGDRQRSRVDALGCDVREGDVSQAASLAGLCEGVDTVYHLAAVIVSHDPSVFQRVNRQGTENIVREASRAGVRHLVYVSSASVTYPRRTPYAESKLQAEEIVRAAGLGYSIVRPTLVYEPGGGQELMLFLDYLRRFPLVPFIGNGSALKRPVWSGDVVDGLVRLLGNPIALGKTYNLSGAEAISMLELARLLLAHHDRQRPIVPVPVLLCRALAWLAALLMQRPPLTPSAISGVVNDADLDPSLAMRELGYHPLGVREGFRRCFPIASPSSAVASRGQRVSPTLEKRNVS